MKVYVVVTRLFGIANVIYDDSTEDEVKVFDSEEKAKDYWAKKTRYLLKYAADNIEEDINHSVYHPNEGYGYFNIETDSNFIVCYIASDEM